jgi:hypothetical protein
MAEVPAKKSNKKRKRDDDNTRPLMKAYSQVKAFEPVPSTGRPGTPHRYFESSYRVSFQEKEDMESQEKPCLSQIIHHHCNGLAVVTIGENAFLNRDENIIQSIQFCVNESPAGNAAEKRKRQSKMLKGKQVPGMVTPSTVLAKLTLSTGLVFPIYASVWGAVLELNKNVDIQTLNQDPLLDGYIAVILPTGPFPPPLEQHDVVPISKETKRER